MRDLHGTDRWSKLTWLMPLRPLSNPQAEGRQGAAPGAYDKRPKTYVFLGRTRVNPFRTVREVPAGFHGRKSSFYPHGEGHSGPQKRARWAPATANGVPAELGEQAPAGRTWPASERSKAPVRRAPCSVHSCTHGPTPLFARTRTRSVRWPVHANKTLVGA